MKSACISFGASLVFAPALSHSLLSGGDGENLLHLHIYYSMLTAGYSEDLIYNAFGLVVLNELVKTCFLDTLSGVLVAHACQNRF